MPGGEDFLIGDDGDWIDDGAGDFEQTLTAQPALRHQVLDELGGWVGDPDAGREQRPLLGRNNTEAEREQEEDTVVKALQVLERAGLITDIETEVLKDAVGRFFVRSVSRDTQAGGQIDQTTLTEFEV